MAFTIVAAGAAMRATLARYGASAPDGRFAAHYAQGPRMPFPVIMDHERGGWFLAVFFALVILLAFESLFAGAALRRCGARAPALLFAGLALVLAAMTSFPVVFSLDSYAYAAFGRLLGIYGLNPYTEHLASGVWPHDRIFGALSGFLGSPLPDENYGPLWTALAAALSRLSPGESLGLAIWSQRAIAAIALVVAAAGVFALLPKGDAGSRAAAVARFALHPLALYESAAAAHNDMLMLAPAVWAFALTARSPLAAGVLLGAAVSIKYVALLALPFLMLRAWRSGGLRAAMQLSLAAVATIVACFVPLWPGLDDLRPILGLGSTLIMSPMWLATMWIPFVSAHWLAVVFAAAFVIVFALSVWRYRSDCRPAHAFRSIAALLWASPLLNPWYVQWLLPAASSTGRWANYAWWFGLFVSARYVEDALRFPATQAEFSARVALLETITIAILVLPILLSSETVHAWLHRRGATPHA